MPQYEVFAVPENQAAAIRVALDRAFAQHKLDVRSCDLIGAQNNTRVVVRPSLADHRSGQFGVTLESITDGSLGNLIEAGLNGIEWRKPGSSEVM